MTLFPSGWSSGAGEQVCRVIIRPRLAGLDVEQRGSEIVGGAASTLPFTTYTAVFSITEP